MSGVTPACETALNWVMDPTKTIPGYCIHIRNVCRLQWGLIYVENKLGDEKGVQSMWGWLRSPTPSIITKRIFTWISLALSTIIFVINNTPRIYDY